MARMTVTILLLFILSVVNSKKIWEEAEERWIEAKDDVREDWEKFKHDVEDNWDDVKDDWDGFVGDWKKAFKDVFHRDLDKVRDPFENWESRKKRSVFVNPKKRD